MRFKLLRRPTVERITGLSRSAIYEQIARGAFPPPVRLGPNCVAWRSDQIEDWITSRPPCTGRRGMMRGRDMVRITIGEPGGDQQTVIMPRLLAATLAETHGAGATGLSVPNYMLAAYRKRVRQLRVFGISIEEARGRLVLGTPIAFEEAQDA